ncbi:MAG: ribose 5-phosphate isomerase B [Elusimicrobiales bacterium]|nr:ribose 5-phosphate isomerase B [Elusimicrobiales bacterium]
MKIAIGSDHAGYNLKKTIIEFLKLKGHSVIDVGTNNPDIKSDYPDFAKKVSNEIISKNAERGIIICGSGVGACIAANKIKGIRASVCHDTYSAHQGVEHDNMNVLCMGAKVIGSQLACEIVDAFINAKFIEEERYIRRLNKIKLIEEEK